MKQLYTLKFLVLIAILISNSPLLAGTYGGGDGSEGNPYLIGTSAHLLEMDTTTADWGAFFKLTADIDMADQTFLPIGYNNGEITNFTGHIDGDKHVIKNLTMSKPEDQPAKKSMGLIAEGMDCTIKNLGLLNFTINDASSNGYIGAGMIGNLSGENALISNCFVTGQLNGRNNVGSFCGKLNNGKIENCVAAVVFDSYYDNRTGGIIGNIDNGILENCVFYGYFKKRGAPAAESGGIVGQVTADKTFSNCYFNASSNGILVPKNGTAEHGTKKTIEELRTKGTYAGFDFDAPKWTMLENGFAVLKDFDADNFKVTATATVNADSTGTGTIDPASKTVNIGEPVTFNFTTTDYVSGITIDGVAQTVDRPENFTIEAAYYNHDVKVAFNSFPAGIKNTKPSALKMYVANDVLNIDGCDVGSNSCYVYGLSGKLIAKKQFIGENLNQNINLSNGIYVVQVNTGGKTISKKVVVR